MIGAPPGRAGPRRYPVTSGLLCSRMNCCTEHGSSPPFAVEPLLFRPQNDWMPGHAPVIAPARRLT